MVSQNQFDIIIIGTGAGGGTLAHRLAPTGKRILILERGDYVPREKANWDSRAVNVNGAVPHERSVARQGRQAIAPAHELLRRRQHQILWRCALPASRARLRQIEHHGGVSPAWPIRYDDLEPYYTRAERLYEVHGTRGEDPTDPRASSDLSAFPRSATNRAFSSFSDDFARLGLSPFHVPLGIRLDEQTRTTARAFAAIRATDSPASCTRSPTRRCCASIPHSKYPNVTLLTNAYVVATGDERNRAARSPSCTYSATAPTKSTPPTSSWSSCGAINSAALLLRSANDQHPRGLANCSDVVGRHYMGHINSVLMAVSKCPNPTVFQKTLGVNDFYFGSKELRSRWGTSPSSASSTAWRFPPGRRRSRRDSRSTSWRSIRSTSG